MNDNKRDEILRALIGGELYRAVEDAVDALRSRGDYDLLNRSRGDYDLLNSDERRFVLLCWALERSAASPLGANEPYSTNINLSGAMRALDDITKGSV